MKLNIGCGAAKREGYVNIDAFPGYNPDLVLDVTSKTLPFESGTVELVSMFHTIEHIRREQHAFVLAEINRVLEVNGDFLIAFPNAKVCLENYLANKSGDRAYWEKTIMGRGITSWDLHRSLIYLEDFLPLLNSLGFGHFKVTPEVGQEQNTFISCSKTFTVIERTELIRNEVMNEA